MVERKKQLSNVAFGGDWSEGLVVADGLQDVLIILRVSAMNCDETDPRGPQLNEVLDFIEQHIEKGKMLRAGIERALSQPNPGLRKSEASKYVSMIEASLGL